MSLYHILSGALTFGFLFVSAALPSAIAQESDQILQSQETDSNNAPNAEQGNATERAANTPTTPPLSSLSMIERAEFNTPGFSFDAMPSLFFTPRTLALLNDAKRGFVARNATPFEIDQASRNAEEGTAPPKGPREINIGGIVYAGNSDWTVWLNGQKITPDRLPPEILDIQVRKDYVRLKWYDAYTNQIFPIKLKTQQRFNLDSRIFLPG